MKLHKHAAAYFLVFIAILYFITISILIPFYQNYFYPASILPDSITYMDAARLIYKDGFAFHPTRPFGYPLLIGLPYLFGSANDSYILNFAVFLNILFWLVSIVYLQKIIEKLIGSKIAFFVTLIFIFTFSYTYFIYQAMTEILFTLVLILFSYALLMYIDKRKSIYLCLALFFLSYSTVVRPINIYFSIVFFVFCLFLSIKKKEFKLTGISICIFLATIGLQMGMMKYETGKFAISFIQNYTIDRFLITRAEYLKAHYKGNLSIYSYKDNNALVAFYNNKWNPKDSLYNLITGKENIVKYWADSDKQYIENIKSSFKNNSYLFLDSYCCNLIENTKNGSFFPRLLTWEQKNYHFDLLKKIISNITSLQNKLFCFCAILMTLLLTVKTIFYKHYAKKHFIFVCILNIIIIYLFLASGISFWQADRFNIVWYPLLLICLPYEVLSLLPKKHNK